jgi:hypothetical protein
MAYNIMLFILKFVIIVLLSILSWVQLFIVIYPGYNFSLNIIGLTINAFICVLMMSYISCRLGSGFGLLSTTALFFGLYFSIGSIFSNVNDDVVVGLIFTPIFSMILIVFIIINLYRLFNSGKYKFIGKAVQQVDAPEPASPAR